MEDSEEARKLDYEAAPLLVRGDYEQAEKLFRQAMSLRENTFGKDHPSIARSLCNLAEVRRTQGRPAEEEVLYEQAFQLQEHAYPQGHPYTAHILTRLGHIYWKDDRMDVAESMLGRALEIRRQYLGADHHQTAASARHLAMFYLSQGRQSEADALLAQSQYIVRNMMAPVFTILTRQMAELSQKLMAAPDADVEQLTQAEPAILRSIKRTQDLVGPNDPVIAAILDHYAVILRRLGRDQEAEVQEACARAIREKNSNG
ncbi:MAG TPA: tetratricopeptide repeat protein [Chthonomonadaceae bacterium]|nr:tetratricopeptide repeat protein [Chthonomonadaceae bacterium]